MIQAMKSFARTSRLSAGPSVILLGLLGACSSPSPARPALTVVPDVPAVAPGPEVLVHWKERLALAYVFVDHVGDYRTFHEAMNRLFVLADQHDVKSTGAPFALFLDDPGRVPATMLRARACLPVEGPIAQARGLGYDLLPGGMVAYTKVSGPLERVPLAYPAILRFIVDRGWQVSGPVCEVYLQPPTEVENEAELVTEVQMPWRFGG